MKKKVTSSETWSHLQCEAGGKMPLPVLHPGIHYPTSQLLLGLIFNRPSHQGSSGLVQTSERTVTVAEPELESHLMLGIFICCLPVFCLLYNPSLHVLALLVTLCCTVGQYSLVFSTILKNFGLLTSGSCLFLIFA